jgi:hypothetical protein
VGAPPADDQRLVRLRDPVEDHPCSFLNTG